MLNALILAGDQYIKSWNENINKALLSINGKIMIRYVIEALKGAGGIDRIIVVGKKSEFEDLLKDYVDAVVDSSGSIIENIMAGVRYLGCEEPLLICSSDIPLITPEAINDFIIKSKNLHTDLCYPIVEKSSNERVFPEIERSYVRLREGTFTGGNIFYVNPAILEKGYTFADKLLNARKNPVKMARILGLGFMLQLLLGTLSIAKVENKVSRMMNINAKAVISEYPEIGNDVDKASDVIVATAHLSR